MRLWPDHVRIPDVVIARPSGGRRRLTPVSDVLLVTEVEIDLRAAARG